MQLARIAALQPEWIYFGTLYQMEAGPPAEVHRLIEALPRRAPFLRRQSAPRKLYGGVGTRIDRARARREVQHEEAELFPDSEAHGPLP